jgi:hypothetical protein
MVARIKEYDMDDAGGSLTWLDKLHITEKKLSDDAAWCLEKAELFSEMGNEKISRELKSLGEDLLQYSKDLRLATSEKVSEDLRVVEQHSRVTILTALAMAGVDVREAAEDLAGEGT